MRKDVKIGLGIGGVLLAVLIVYALVPKNDTANQFAHGGDANKSADESGQGTSPASGTGGAATAGSPVSTGETTAPAPTGHDAPPGNTTTGGNATTGGPVASREPASADPAEQDALATTPKVIDWEKILVTGLVPEDAKVPMAARANADDVFAEPKSNANEPKWDVTPPAGRSPQTAHSPQAGHNTQTATADHSARGSQTQGSPAANARPQAARGGTTEHTVQQGENLSMIAAVAYGDARKYKEILKANPGLDERKIRPGTVIKLPDPSTFAPATTAAHQAKADAKPETKIDPKSQYKVEQDDNLSRISSKLYGSTAKAKAIYEANKDTIGADPGKLKLGTVLKLPEPPTVQQAAR
jgi:nucleoid-associated protein YgaU